MRSRLVCTSLCALLTVAACRNQVPSADVVARINGEAVTKQAFEDVVARHLKRYGDQRQNLAEGVVARLQESVLRSMVEERIVAQRAEAEGLAVTDAELDEKLAAHRGRFRNREAYDDYLARANTTEPQLKEELRKSLLRDRLVDKLGGAIEVDADEVRRYYTQNAEQFVVMPQTRAHRLLLAYPKDATEAQRRDVKKRAHALYVRGKKAPADFGALCREHSSAPEAGRDGDLGLVPVGRMPELDKLVAAGLRPGHVSEPVATAHGVALFRLDAHTPKQQQPLAEVESAIRTNLLVHRRNERRQEILRQLTADAKVDLRISFDPRPAAAPSQAPAQTPPPAPAPAPQPPPARQEVGARGVPQAGRWT